MVSRRPELRPIRTVQVLALNAVYGARAKKTGKNIYNRNSPTLDRARGCEALSAFDRSVGLGSLRTLRFSS